MEGSRADVAVPMDNPTLQRPPQPPKTPLNPVLGCGSPPFLKGSPADVGYAADVARASGCRGQTTNFKRGRAWHIKLSYLTNIVNL